MGLYFSNFFLVGLLYAVRRSIFRKGMVEGGLWNYCKGAHISRQIHNADLLLVCVDDDSPVDKKRCSSEWHFWWAYIRYSKRFIFWVFLVFYGISIIFRSFYFETLILNLVKQLSFNKYAVYYRQFQHRISRTHK